MDEGRADDLVQDAWLVALERRMRHGRSPRAWLARWLPTGRPSRGAGSMCTDRYR